jgi:2-C-methyl-D-erythritol 4-phosphate cytidylyltransferase
VLLKAYQQDYVASFTDDASVVEALGVDVHLIQGNKENIKITTAEDLKIAEIYTSF